ncbi:hypothetical protein LINPERHAP2_LOCUS30322 [Linum perenne]
MGQELYLGHDGRREKDSFGGVGQNLCSQREWWSSYA